jgi:hypothetical protein
MTNIYQKIAGFTVGLSFLSPASNTLAITVDIFNPSYELLPSQSFNETRGINITPLVDFQIDSITLDGFSLIDSEPAPGGWRIYDSNSATLLASVDTILIEQTVTSPLNFIFTQGNNYRISFFAGGQNNSGTFAISPDPFGNPTPFVVNGLIQVRGAFQSNEDAFPNNDNLAFPLISFTGEPVSDSTSVPEPSSLLGLLAVGVVGIGSALKKKVLS